MVEAVDGLLSFGLAAAMACFFSEDLGAGTDFFCTVCLAAVIDGFLVAVFVVTDTFLSLTLALTLATGLFLLTDFAGGG